MLSVLNMVELIYNFSIRFYRANRNRYFAEGIQDYMESSGSQLIKLDFFCLLTGYQETTSDVVFLLLQNGKASY